jgi:pimeloyl-ACP methyl ester carboxylesterase
MPPETVYAKSGEVNIAYQVVGKGPVDLVLVPGFISHLELDWQGPGYALMLDRLSSFARVIRFDKRGTGLSDRPGGLPDLESRMDDVRAVLDAAGTDRAALMGYSEGGPLSMLFAATYPERTTSLVLYGTYAKRRNPDDDYPWCATWEERQAYADAVEREWGSEADLGTMSPNAGPAEVDWWRRRARAAASPGAAKALILMNSNIDVRGILSAIHVPTLVLHRTGDRDSRPEEGRYIAERIPGARFVELEGEDHVPWIDSDQILDEVEEFLTGVRRGPDLRRVLATVLFTDIVGSTSRAVELGDRGWHSLLEQHHATVRRELGRFRGSEVDTAGDGFLATFDGPARAVRCAQAIRSALSPLGIDITAGVHSGEVEVGADGAIAGVAVHIGARVAGQAQPGEVLASSTVKDLVAGSGLEFEDRGVHELKGVPGDWHLYAVRQ